MHIVGINGGHLKSTISVFCTEQRKEIYRGHGDSLNLHLFPTLRIIYRADRLLSAAARQCGYKDTKAFADASIGLTVAYPGAFRESDREQAETATAAFAKGFRDFGFVDDTHAGFFAGAPKTKGICVFSGAGASIGVIDGSLKLKFDGRGPVIGDFGSGFHLVTLFLQHLGRLVDEGRTSTLLNSIRAYCASHDSPSLPQAPDPQNLQVWFDELTRQVSSEWRQQYPSLAEPLLTADSAESIEEIGPLVQECARALAVTYRIATSKIGPVDECRHTIVLQGSVLRKSSSFQSAFLAASGVTPEHAIVSKLKPADGAVLLTAQRCLGAETAAVFHDIMLNSL